MKNYSLILSLFLIFLTGCAKKVVYQYENQTEKDAAIFVLLTGDYIRSIPEDMKGIQEYFITTYTGRDTVHQYFNKKHLTKSEFQDKVCAISSDEASRNNDINSCLAQFKLLAERKHHDLKYVVGGAGEEGVMIAAKLRTELDISSEDFIGADRAEIFVNKKAMKNYFIKKNPSVPTAKFMTMTMKVSRKNIDAYKEQLTASFNESFGTDFSQLIIKPVDQAGSLGIKIFKNIKSFDDFFERFKDYLLKSGNSLDEELTFILEQYITGKIFRFDGFVENGELVYNFVIESSTPPIDFYQNGTPMMESNTDDPELKSKGDKFALESMKALDYKRGIFHLEGILSDSGEHKGEFYFLETAVRPGGDLSEILAYVGYNPRDAYIRSQLGMSIVKNKITKTFDVVEFMAPKIGKSENRFKILKFKLPTDALTDYTTYLADEDFKHQCPLAQGSYVSARGRICFYFFVGDKKDQQLVHDEAQHVFKNTELELKVIRGENYWENIKYLLDTQRWSAPFLAE